MPALSGRRAWVTGASSGIGTATALALSGAGADVVISARRSEKLDQLAHRIQTAGGKAIIKPLDVADRSAVRRTGSELEQMGGIDILINNAGLMPLAPIIEGRVDEWEQTIDVNVKGVLFCINAAFPGMAKRRRGHIVNIGSVAGRIAFKGGAVYCGTKFAVRAISDSLRKEALEFGVRVTDVEPGAVATELTESIKHEATRKAVTGEGGFYAPEANILTAEDIANAILYAVTQPDHVTVCELLIRPQSQEL